MCVCGRVAMVTGWFGKGNKERVAELAALSGATWKTPMYQEVWTGDQLLVHPSYIIIFGRFKLIKPRSAVAGLEPEFFGPDLVGEMEPSAEVPTWALNYRGSCFVQKMGQVKMNDPDVSKMPRRCCQTSVCFGSALPSQRRQKQKAAEKARAKGRKRPIEWNRSEWT